MIAVNGGAVIPALLSLYLLFKNRMWWNGAIATAVITVIIHMLAYPVSGVGIAVPMLVPPIATALVAVLIARENAAALAYVSGSLGTLIGADLLNLDAVPELGAPVASIGGAGTFDGIHPGLRATRCSYAKRATASDRRAPRRRSRFFAGQQVL